MKIECIETSLLENFKNDLVTIVSNNGVFKKMQNSLNQFCKDYCYDCRIRGDI